MTYSSDVPYVNRVIAHLDLKPASYVRARDARQVHGCIQEALAMIAPFRPSQEALHHINNYLFFHKANQMQCIVARTMFMDVRSLANLHNVPEGRGRSESAA